MISKRFGSCFPDLGNHVPRDSPRSTARRHPARNELRRGPGFCRTSNCRTSRNLGTKRKGFLTLLDELARAGARGAWVHCPRTPSSRPLIPGRAARGPVPRSPPAPAGCLPLHRLPASRANRRLGDRRRRAATAAVAGPRAPFAGLAVGRPPQAVEDQVEADS
jgi:hypothetical protein